jgi:hypothetical protein
LVILSSFGIFSFILVYCTENNLATLVWMAKSMTQIFFKRQGTRVQSHTLYIIEILGATLKAFLKKGSFFQLRLHLHTYIFREVKRGFCRPLKNCSFEVHNLPCLGWRPANFLQGVASTKKFARPVQTYLCMFLHRSKISMLHMNNPEISQCWMSPSRKITMFTFWNQFEFRILCSRS